GQRCTHNSRGSGNRPHKLQCHRGTAQRSEGGDSGLWPAEARTRTPDIRSCARSPLIATPLDPLITFWPKDPQPVLPVAETAQERKISGYSVFLACVHIKTHV